ncbi:MAG: alpha/beta hydrolase [Myxococcales bacterium]|nr:alpha/beta hydrolase [Myxococcales bacterium]
MRSRTLVSGVPDGFSERRVALGEVTLNYVVGPDRGPALLLIPGQMESWQGYKPVLPALAERFQVFVPDLRGHGRSTRTPGRYSYNRIGEDLVAFIDAVIGRPALVAGLSSGGVLALWLGANAPAEVLAVIAEDPPIFSSVWPRIAEEKYLAHTFRTAVATLGGERRDLRAFHAQMGIPNPKGGDELLRIPAPIVRLGDLLLRAHRRLRPRRPYDLPLLPFNLRASLKFLSEYDPDFSRATVEGDLSAGFAPEATLAAIRCPVLLLRVPATRHPTWGILGAIDDDDLLRIKALVGDLEVVEFPGRHEIHMQQPERYVAEVTCFVDDLRRRGDLADKLAPRSA